MKKMFSGIVLLFVLSVASAFAGTEMKRIPTTYDTQAAFEKGEGKICLSATDGCNTCGVKDGKVTMCTQMACSKPIAWSCTKFIKQEDTSFMSTNDRNFYTVIGNRIDQKLKKRVDEVLKIYLKKLSKFSEEKSQDTNTRIQEVIQKKYDTFSMTIPADKGMTKKEQRAYYFYQYLLFKLKIIGNTL